MTCGDPITEETLHEYIMAATYWKQQYEKLLSKMNDLVVKEKEMEKV